MLDYILAAWTANPVRAASLLTAAVIAIAKATGLALDDASVTELVGLVGLVVGGAEVARSKVTPYPGEIGPNSDDLLPTVPEA